MTESFHGPLFDQGNDKKVEVPAGAPYQPHSITSRDAARLIKPVAGTWRAKVLDYIRNNRDYGATDEEIQIGLALKTNSELPRRVELMDAGLIKDSGRTRINVSKRDAVVWVATTEEEAKNFIPKNKTDKKKNLADEIADLVPTTWLDDLLSGPNKVELGNSDCREIEVLLRAVKDRIYKHLMK